MKWYEYKIKTYSAQYLDIDFEGYIQAENVFEAKKIIYEILVKMISKDSADVYINRLICKELDELPKIIFTKKFYYKW